MTNQPKPRIRCSHHERKFSQLNYVKVAGCIGCLTWQDILDYATNGNAALRYPNTARAVRAAITF